MNRVSVTKPNMVKENLSCHRNDETITSNRLKNDDIGKFCFHVFLETVFTLYSDGDCKAKNDGDEFGLNAKCVKPVEKGEQSKKSRNIIDGQTLLSLREGCRVSAH